MSEAKPNGNVFEPGHAKVGGRKKGSRNKLSESFIKALCEDFDEHGADAIRLMRVETPAMYARVIASIVPKEYEINDNRLKDIPDDELDAIIEYTRARLAKRSGAGDTDSGEAAPLN